MAQPSSGSISVVGHAGTSDKSGRLSSTNRTPQELLKGAQEDYITKRLCSFGIHFLHQMIHFRNYIFGCIKNGSCVDKKVLFKLLLPKNTMRSLAFN